MQYQQPLAKFGANWIMVVLSWVIGSYLLYLTFTYLGMTWIGALVAALGLLMIVGLGIHLPLATVKVFADRVCYDRITGHSEMRWDQIQNFHYHAQQFRAYFVPLIIVYSFRLEDVSGNKVKFGEGLWKGKQLAELMIRLTTPVINKRLTQLFEMGEKLSFGSIEISRLEGIRARATFGKLVTTPWNMFAGSRLHAGAISILRRDKANGGTAAVATTPNVFALHHLLTMIARNGIEAAPQSQAQAAKVDLG